MASPLQPVTRYAVAATLARIGDAGAGVGVVLLAVSRLGPRGAAVGGLLAAALTVPHLAGPWLGRAVDRVRDTRRPLAAGCAVYALALAAAVGLLDRGWPWPAGAALLVAGLCGPLLTGGLSSLVAGLGAGAGRARGVDAVTYGVAGSGGPAAVAGLATASPTVGLWGVAGVVLVAAGLVRTLPAALVGARTAAPVATPAVTPLATPAATSPCALLFTSRPLRRVAVTTLASSAAGGAFAVAAVLLAVELTGSGGGGAWLVGALGIGNLAGSLVVLARPLRGDPVRWSLVLVAGIGVGYLLVAVAADYVLAVTACVVVGLVTAPWITATLAARDRHAPEGRRTQVFVAMAGWKVAAGAAGSAVAGVAAGLGPRVILAVGAVVTLTSVAAAWLDRARVPETRSAVAASG